MLKNIIGAGAVVLGLAAASSGVAVAFPRPIQVTPLDTRGQDTPSPDGAYENGWQVPATPTGAFSQTYLQLRAWLGEPVSAFDGQCQSFRFGRLCYDPAKAEEWQVELGNVGWADLQVEGFTPKLDSTPHPALRAWKLEQLVMGTDLTRVVGRTISDPLCDPKSRQCRQWTDKQLFLFAADAAAADQVRRAPLGLWLAHPSTREAGRIPHEMTAESTTPLTYLGVAAALSLLGVALLRYRGRRTITPSI